MIFSKWTLCTILKIQMVLEADDVNHTLNRYE